MASFSTTVQKLGINGILLSTIGGEVGVSTATSSVTFTCGDLNRVFVWGYNPAGVETISATLSAASTSAGYASVGRGSLVLTTNISSSSYFMIGNLESNWFQTTSNTFTITFSTALLCGVCEIGSSRVN